MDTQKRYSPEVRERAVHLVFEYQSNYESEWAAIGSIESKIGCTPVSLPKWVRRSQIDQEKRGGITSSDREQKRVNEILRKASAFLPRRVRPAAVAAPTEVMISFIDSTRLNIGSSRSASKCQLPHRLTYAHKAREDDPDWLSDRAWSDRSLEPEVQRVWEENFRIYGAMKVWRQLNREAIEVDRCTVERLMSRLDIQGATRGAKC